MRRIKVGVVLDASRGHTSTEWKTDRNGRECEQRRRVGVFAALGDSRRIRRRTPAYVAQRSFSSRRHAAVHGAPPLRRAHRLGSAAARHGRTLCVGSPRVGTRPACADPGRDTSDRFAVSLRHLRRHPGDRASCHPRRPQGSLSRATVGEQIGARRRKCRQQTSAACHGGRQSASCPRPRNGHRARIAESFARNAIHGDRAGHPGQPTSGCA